MNVEEFIKLIRRSLNQVEQDYYMVTTTYRPLGIVRERVFCYELYHQMRCLQEEMGFSEIYIHGEIDKRGHELFHDAQQNPDFIFHVPGTMDNNCIVVEVKGCICNRSGVWKDIRTLSKFTNSQHNYQQGILVIYNYSINDFRERFNEYIKLKMKEEELAIDQIQVLCKKNCNAPVENEYLSAILK